MTDQDAPAQVLSGINRCLVAFLIGWVLGAGLMPMLIEQIVSLG
jgi:hypothetical protein